MTTNAFARHIGLPRAENLYQIKRGNNGISNRLAARIAGVYNEISLSWLLTGRGAMFVDEEEMTAVVPYFEEDICVAAGVVDALEPVCDMVVPGFARCDLAMRCGSRGAADGQDDRTADGEVTVLLLRRCAGEEPLAAGEYVALEGGRGVLCTIGESECDGELMRRLYFEVTGRMVVTRPAVKR